VPAAWELDVDDRHGPAVLRACRGRAGAVGLGEDPGKLRMPSLRTFVCYSRAITEHASTPRCQPLQQHLGQVHRTAVQEEVLPVTRCLSKGGRAACHVPAVILTQVRAACYKANAMT
jgi:hypothetical protein